jgi:hypothetical protein
MARHDASDLGSNQPFLRAKSPSRPLSTTVGSVSAFSRLLAKHAGEIDGTPSGSMARALLYEPAR